MHHCFPNCHLYLINFAPGTCGSLLSSIIYYMLTPNSPLLSEQENFTNAHDTLLSSVNDTWTNESLTDLGYNRGTYIRPTFLLPTLNEPAGINAYQRVKPKDKNKFLVLIDHTNVYDYNRLVSVYPVFTEFLITIKPEDRNQLDFIIFLKFMCELEGEPLLSTWQSMKNVVLKNNPNYDWINSYERPKHILENTEHYKLFVQSYFNKPVNPEFFGRFDYRNYEKIISQNPKYKDKIHSINFKTILTDSETTLNQVSNILQVPVTDNARVVYDRWINKQVLLESFLDK